MRPDAFWRWLARGVVLLALAGFHSLSEAQVEPLIKRPRSEKLLSEPAQKSKDQPIADTESDIGIPYSEVLRDTEPPYEDMFRDVKLRGTLPVKLGEAGAKFHANFFQGLSVRTPLSRGLRPETSELKLGNFYVDVISLSGSALYSDNVDLDEVDRDDGAIAILRLRLGALLQLGDNFRIGVVGAFIYLPLKNVFGVAGFGVDDPLAQFDYSPLFQAQIAYDMYVGQWEIELIDDFRVRHRRFGANLDFELFDGVTFDEQDQAGRFRTRSQGFSTGSGVRRRNDRLGTNLLETRNLVGVYATRMLPTVTRVELGAFHENRWYANDRNDTLNLPNTYDYAFANLISERESLRFKPYARYRVDKYDYDENPDHWLRGGIHGPVTEYTHLLGEVGYFWSGDNNAESYTWRVRLEQNPTPLIYHALQYSRSVTEVDRDIEDQWLYRLRYKINDELHAELFGSLSHFEDLDKTDSGGDESRAGLRFTWNIGQRTHLQWGAVYSKIENDRPTAADTETWTARASIQYRHTQSLDSRLTYQYQTHDSSRPLDSYYENLVLYTLTKYF